MNVLHMGIRPGFDKYCIVFLYDIHPKNQTSWGYEVPAVGPKFPTPKTQAAMLQPAMNIW